MPRYRFAPPLWASLSVTLAMGVMITAGYWQHGRGQQKEALIARMLAAELAPPEQTLRLPAADPQLPRKVLVRGRFDAARQLLQDNQTLDRRPGYHVWTPLQTGGGQWLLVDRGWVPQNPDRSILPDLPVPAGTLELAGVWRALPRPGLRLAGAGCAAGAWPRVVQYPDAADLACTLGEPVAEGLLLMDPQAEGGFARRWQVTPEMPPEKHYGYALQWFAMALVLGILFFKLNLKRSA